MKQTRTFGITASMVVALTVFGFIAPTSAQTAPQAQVSQAAMVYAEKIANACLKNWSAPQCLSVVSESNRVLASNYMEVLDKAGKKPAVETIKNHCAASTASEKQTFPADAMKSAFVECANTINDVSTASGTVPDLSHYELLIAAILCMDGNDKCVPITATLEQFVRK